MLPRSMPAAPNSRNGSEVAFSSSRCVDDAVFRLHPPTSHDGPGRFATDPALLLT